MKLPPALYCPSMTCLTFSPSLRKTHTQAPAFTPTLLACLPAYTLLFCASTSSTAMCLLPACPTGRLHASQPAQAHPFKKYTRTAYTASTATRASHRYRTCGVERSSSTCMCSKKREMERAAAGRLAGRTTGMRADLARCSALGQDVPKPNGEWHKQAEQNAGGRSSTSAGGGGGSAGGSSPGGGVAAAAGGWAAGHRLRALLPSVRSSCCSPAASGASHRS